jgi:hypothetical protein
MRLLSPPIAARKILVENLLVLDLVTGGESENEQPEEQQARRQGDQSGGKEMEYVQLRGNGRTHKSRNDKKYDIKRNKQAREQESQGQDSSDTLPDGELVRMAETGWTGHRVKELSILGRHFIISLAAVISKNHGSQHGSTPLYKCAVDTWVWLDCTARL